MCVVYVGVCGSRSFVEDADSWGCRASLFLPYAKTASADGVPMETEGSAKGAMTLCFLYG